MDVLAPLIVIAVLTSWSCWSARRCAAARPPAPRSATSCAAPTSRPRASRSTARSATPSSTTGPASSPRPTGSALDRELRREAIEILRAIDELPPPTSRREPAAVTAPLATTSAAMELIFSVIQVVISVVLIFLVLMHSGKDAGLSGAFGVGTGQGPLGGGSLVERNLNRWTVGFAIAFGVNTIILLKSPWN